MNDTVKSSPDYAHLSFESAMSDLQKRIAFLRRSHQSISEEQESDYSFIKLYNFSSQVLSNKVYGVITKTTLPYLMALHVGARPIILVRTGVMGNKRSKAASRCNSISGGSRSSFVTGGNDNNENSCSCGSGNVGSTGCTRHDNSNNSNSSSNNNSKKNNNNKNTCSNPNTSSSSFSFSSSSCCCDGGAGDVDAALVAAALRPSSSCDDSDGWSSCGEEQLQCDAELDDQGIGFAHTLRKFTRRKIMQFVDEFPHTAVRFSDGRINHHACIKVVTSTLPRATQTADIAMAGMEYETQPGLNPLDKGVLSGLSMEAIKTKDPAFYGKWSQKPFTTRFPGGESYSDLVSRLEPMLVDLEQQTAPVVVISHLSVLQALYCYFTGESDITECWKVSIPLFTAIEFTPTLGGRWSEKRHSLLPSPPSASPSADLFFANKA